MNFYKIFIVGMLLISLSSFLYAQAPDSLIMKIDENTYKIDNIKIDIANREITFSLQNSI